MMDVWKYKFLNNIISNLQMQTQFILKCGFSISSEIQ